MGIYCSCNPRPALAAFVDKLWWYEGETAAHARERRLPNGSLELVINLRAEALRVYDPEGREFPQNLGKCLVSGAYARFFVLDTACQTSLMGVSFKPGGAAPFLALPVNELHNIHVALEDLWGTSAGELRERLLAAEEPQARLRLFEQLLLEYAARPLVLPPLVSFALDELQKGRSVAEVTAKIGYSARHVGQVFSETVGLTPKQFSRIRRFQDVLRSLETGRQTGWADLATACGYFDQAHFIHDFRAFSGLTPGAFSPQQREFRNHIPILT